MGTKIDQNEIHILFKTGERFSPGDPPPMPPVRFAEEIFPLFNAGCRCHGAFNPFMNVRFVYDTPEEALAGIVENDSRQCENWKIIEPGRHEKSYLMYKLLGDDRLGSPTLIGERMPPPPESEIPLDIIEKVRNWIEEGAGSGQFNSNNFIPIVPGT